MFAHKEVSTTLVECPSAMPRTIPGCDSCVTPELRPCCVCRLGARPWKRWKRKRGGLGLRPCRFDPGHFVWLRTEPGRHGQKEYPVYRHHVEILRHPASTLRSA